MWVVCGPPRSGTTAMLEAIASWTTLTVRWNLDTEWMSRRQTGHPEAFLELSPAEIRHAGGGDVVKILDPSVKVTPTRAILMIRDPELVSASARRVLGQLIHPEQVEARVEAFRELGWPLDEVRIDELSNLPSQRALFTRLRRSGWPVTTRSTRMITKATR